MQKEPDRGCGRSGLRATTIPEVWLQAEVLWPEPQGLEGGHMERILLIDDEPSIRLFYSDVLAERGYEIHEATSGQEALALIQNGAPDLVILDIKLGPESGLNLLQQIVRDNPRLPIMLLTAYVSFQDDYTSWLADSYVVKSSDPGVFLAEVERLLRGTLPRATPERAFQAVAEAQYGAR